MQLAPVAARHAIRPFLEPSRKPKCLCRNSLSVFLRPQPRSPRLRAPKSNEVLPAQKSHLEPIISTNTRWLPSHALELLGKAAVSGVPTGMRAENRDPERPNPGLVAARFDR